MPARDSNKQGLKRVMTPGGAYATSNYTVRHLRDLKGVRVLTETMPFTTDEAAAAEDALILSPVQKRCFLRRVRSQKDHTK